MQLTTLPVRRSPIIQHAWLAFVALTLLACETARGQWSTQNLLLKPGWNAVYLEVQPEPRECDAIFAGMPVESVWAWNKRFSPVQFIQDPNELLPTLPDWLNYVLPDHPARSTINLYSLQGGHAYLIKVRAGAGSVNWQIKGHPVTPRIQWLSDSFNLVGFHLAQAGAPSFQNFFAASPAHQGQPVFRLNGAGQWERISNPATARLAAGEAYWVYCKGQSAFTGPSEVRLDQREGLAYGRLINEQTIRLKNNSAFPSSFVIRRLASEAPSSSQYPVLAGEVPLSYYKFNLQNNDVGWVPLPAEMEKLDVAPGGEWALRLEARRADMAAFNPPQGHNGVLYQSVLEVTDDFGSRILIPVSAVGLRDDSSSSALAASGGPSLAAPGAPPHFRAGLWVGVATIEKVSQPASISAPAAPVPTASPFQVRLIFHVDAAGKTRLLKQVLQMWKEGTLKPDPANPGRQVVDKPGYYVLITDDSLTAKYTGATLRDGQPVARRISSSHFSFAQPILMAGAGDFGQNTLTCSVPLDFDDRLNPFKHSFHPDHDNLDARFSEKLPAGRESFSITRQVRVQFSAEDPDGLTLAGWGDNQLGGIYQETILGLHHKPLYIEGKFRLHHATTISALNDGL